MEFIGIGINLEHPDYLFAAAGVQLYQVTDLTESVPRSPFN
jgi:hypothetical protein